MISPMDAFQKLKDGYNIFSQSSTKTLKVELGPNEIADLEAGQHPYAIIVTCSDSRVEPNLIFNAGLSELFIVKTAGNIIDSIGLGTIEFALEEFNVPLIVVLGHEKCGAVKATLNSIQSRLIPNNFQACLIKSIEPAVKNAINNISMINNFSIRTNILDPNLLNKSIVENIKLSIKSLFKSEIVTERINTKELLIIGAKYDFNGNITYLENLK